MISMTQNTSDGAWYDAYTLINPYGFHLHEKILYQVFVSKTLGLVQEFLPPDFFNPNSAVIFFMIYLALLPFILKSKRYR